MKKAGSPGKETRLFPKKWFSAAVLAALAGTVLTVLTGAVLAVLTVLTGAVLAVLAGAVLLIGIRRIVHQGFTSLVVLLWENFRTIMRPKRRFCAQRTRISSSNAAGEINHNPRAAKVSTMA